MKKEDYKEMGREHAFTVKNLAHIGMNVKDMEKSLAFYVDGLGMKVKFTLYCDALLEYMEANGKNGIPQQEWEESISELCKQRGLPWIVYLELADHQFLELYYCYDEKSPHPDLRSYYSMHHLSIEVDDINEAYQELQRKGDEPLIRAAVGPAHTFQF